MSHPSQTLSELIEKASSQVLQESWSVQSKQPVEQALQTPLAMSSKKAPVHSSTHRSSSR